MTLKSTGTHTVIGYFTQIKVILSKHKDVSAMMMKIIPQWDWQCIAVMGIWRSFILRQVVLLMGIFKEPRNATWSIIYVHVIKILPRMLRNYCL